MPALRATVRASALAVVAAFGFAQSAAALDDVNTKRLRDAVTVNGVLKHERALQSIANANGGIRASGTPGFDASMEYVRGKLEAAGYDVTEQEFTFPFFRELAPATLAEVSPAPQDIETHTMDYSGSGDVTGTLVPALDNQSPPSAEPGSTAGCEPEDLTPASATEPQVALIQRGTCTFEQKAANAEAAGYDAVVIYNEGQPGRQEPLTGTLGRIFDIPVVGIGFADGDALNAQARSEQVVVHVTTSTQNIEDAATKNLIASTPSGDPDQAIVVGSHLDSVTAGPGINDNGSGSATDLEVALQMAKLKIKPRRQVRFAFWGAEEGGLLGSQHYVDSLTPDEVASIYANLNFDMLASPNYVRFVYDGDGSDTGTSGPPGSAQIEQLFASYYASRNLPTAPTEFDGRSDYGPFIAVGIPAGGLFSGAEGVKTEEEAALYGGTAGAPYDACYHQACDTADNLNTKAISEMSDGVAHATLTLAKSRSGLFEDQSLRGRRTKVRPAQRGPEARR